MPQIRKVRRESYAAVAKGRTRRSYEPGGLSTPGCVAADSCGREVVPDCPVRLCARHMREVYTYVHDIVIAELDRQASRLD